VPAEQILSGTKPPLYLLDSYALIYRSYFAFLSRPLRNNNGENISALFGFARALVTLLDAESAKRKILLAAVLDSKKPTFRHERYPSYKATREKAPQELHDQVGKVEQFLAFLGIAALRLDGYEADDLIATLASRCRNEGRECYIYSSDKDLLQLVGGGVYQLRQSRVSQTPMLECVDAALVKAEWGVNPDKILDLLSLTGDSADNVPGVKGVGAILAKKLLARFGSLDAIYENISVLTGAAPKKLAEGRENAFLSRELIRLVHDVPLNVADIDDFSIENLDRAAAARFLLSEGIPSVARQLVPELEDGGGAAERERKPAAAGGTESQPEKLLDGEELTGPGKYRVIVDLGELEGYFALAAAQGYMALDFETDSLDAWHANPVGISFALKPKEGFYVPMMRHGGEEDCLAPDAVRALLEPLFADGAFTVVAHNAKYDYAVSRGWGIPRWKAKIYDTMIAAWLCDTERSGFSLDSLSFS
jgi:DNA polymerase-1